MKYGLPYKGSKSAIAEWVVSCLPASHTLVDLFAGGCAVTHAALLSGKWETVVANDISDTVAVFMEAANGGFDGYATVPTREEFLASDDKALNLLYSFGNDSTTYLWSHELEGVKVPASKMLLAPSVHERYSYYREFCRAFLRFLRGNGDSGKRLDELEQLPRIERLPGIERLQRFNRIDVSGEIRALRGDYRLVDIPEGATVYADPPYRCTNQKGYGDFDFDAFDAWLGGVEFPVYVSEYTCPPGCVEVANRMRQGSMAATGSKYVTERIFIQERFAGSIKRATLF